MALTAREWLLLSEDEQQRRGPELSSEECRKLRMELSEIHFSEEEKRQMTEEERYRFTHPRKLTEEEKTKNAKRSFEVMKNFKMIPKEVTFEEWVVAGKPIGWRR